MIVGFQPATLHVMGRTIQVHVSSAPNKGRVFCRSIDGSCAFGARVGQLRNEYIGGYRLPVSVSVRRLRSI